MNSKLFCKAFDFIIARLKDENSSIIGKLLKRPHEEPCSVALDRDGDSYEFTFYVEEHFAMASSLVIRMGFPHIFIDTERNRYSPIHQIIKHLMDQGNQDHPEWGLYDPLRPYTINDIWRIDAPYDIDQDNGGNEIIVAEYDKKGEPSLIIDQTKDTPLFESHLRQQLIEGFTIVFGELRKLLEVLGE